MGGFGTWEMIQRRPYFFAAAIPVCGGGDANLGKILIKMPIWAFHGAKDKAVPVIRTIDMFNNIKKEIGSSPIKIKMQIYESKGHFIWNEVYTNAEVINWLIKQKRD
jgi:predicted peptidase